MGGADSDGEPGCGTEDVGWRKFRTENKASSNAVSGDADWARGKPFNGCSYKLGRSILEKIIEDQISRPSFSESLVTDVWNMAPKGTGVYPRCEVCSNEINWKIGDSRIDVWDVGHKPGEEFWRLVKEVKKGSMTYEDFLNYHTIPTNFRPEHSTCNRSHKGEVKGLFLNKLL